jgi:hypothetical protein
LAANWPTSALGTVADGRVRPIADVSMPREAAAMNVSCVACSLLLLLAALGTPASAASDVRCAAKVEGYAPAAGLVSSQSVAVALARTYLSEVYGARQINGQLPLKAKVHKGVWRVEGTLKPGLKGGVAEIEICQSTGQVLSIEHGK